MSSSIHHYLLLVLALLTITGSAVAQPRPKALVIPTSKDTKTLQYIINLNQRTPPISTPLTIDLKSDIPWSQCDRTYISTRNPIKCNSPQCGLTNSNCLSMCNKPDKPDCSKTDCTLFFGSPFNPNSKTSGQLISDTVRINSTNGANVGRLVSAQNFLLGCSPTRPQGLAKHVTGIAAFGRSSKLSLPSQFSSIFGFSNKFALCLNSNWSTGVLFFGPGKPYRLYPGPEDITTLFSYTKLITNPKYPSEYYITVSKIVVNKTTVPIDTSFLTLNPKTGTGGTKISTINPYSILQTSIYNAITTAFDSELRKYSLTQVKRVAPVAPFTVCYDRNTLFFTRIGVVVPEIKLVLENDKVVWTIFGTNSMVDINGNVICLGFVDGGVDAKEGIVIGGYQFENNLLEFDLGESRLGFTNSLQYEGGTTCGNFNFTLV